VKIPSPVRAGIEATVESLAIAALSLAIMSIPVAFAFLLVGLASK
jgi:hypothetical protein